MKFCFIQDIDTKKVLGKEYEQPYQYSEYTQGGGSWNTAWVTLSDAIDSDNEDVSLNIFETKKKAEEYLKQMSYWIENRKIRIVILEEK